MSRRKRSDHLEAVVTGIAEQMLIGSKVATLLELLCAVTNGSSSVNGRQSKQHLSASGRPSHIFCFGTSAPGPLPVTRGEKL
jgi:hypothetical protein